MDTELIDIQNPNVSAAEDTPAGEATNGPVRQSSTASLPYRLSIEIIAEDVMSASRYVFYFCIFMLMGTGANFSLPTVLLEQIPYFEISQPEGLCIATYMNVVTSCGFLTLLLYVYFITYIHPIPFWISVPGMLWVSALGGFLTAIVYPVTDDGISILLYLCCWIGGSVGSLAMVIMNPYMVIYESNFISAVRAGGSVFVLLCASIAAAQGPGTSYQRFSASVYCSIMGAILALAIPSYYFLDYKKVGLKEQISKVSMTDDVNNPIVDETGETLTAEAAASSPAAPSSITSEKDSNIDYIEYYKELESKLEFENKGLIFQIKLKIISFLQNIIKLIISSETLQTYPWFLSAVPYMMIGAWVNFNTWGIISAIFPFAIFNSFPNNEAAFILGLGYQLGGAALVLGDISTTIIQVDFFYGIILFTTFVIVVYSAAGGASSFNTRVGSSFVLICYFFVRFIEAHLVTSSFRKMAAEFHPKHREVATFTVGIAMQSAVFSGAIVTTIIVSLLYSCG